jgi:hypothetical protein
MKQLLARGLNSDSNSSPVIYAFNLKKKVTCIERAKSDRGYSRVVLFDDDRKRY